MTHPATRLLALTAAVVCAVSGLSACGGSKKKPVSSSSTISSAVATTAVSPAPTPTPTPTKHRPTGPGVNPLTGVGAPSTSPVIAVKIDDTAPGRPQLNIDQADIVYIEQAEGGLSRMVAVFGTNKPVVEPVRSVRASDAELLSQYGKIALVASGGGGDSLTTLDHSIVTGIINDRGAAGFSRDGSRPAPYNLQANLAQMAAAAKTGGSKSVGFVWSAAWSKLTGAPAAPSISTVVGSTPVTFVWSPGTGKYVRTVDGNRLSYADGKPAATPNVLIQFCTITTNPNDVDVNGNPSQFTHTVGSGKVVLFRNGKRFNGKWSRASETSATKFTDLNGKALPMAPGGAYVVLAANGAPA
ncbi:MAG: hypothetical protein JWO63_420 [Frankiales bacterium]|nr:hypothetical protein [Frankiales bacterium]